MIGMYGVISVHVAYDRSIDYVTSHNAAIVMAAVTVLLKEQITDNTTEDLLIHRAL